MIVVTGATGKLGTHVVELLLAKVPADTLAVAVRNPAKAAAWKKRGVQVHQADYENPQSWEKALAGAEKVLLISGNEMGKRVAQHSAVIQAAVKARVGVVAYTSLLHADSSTMLLAPEHQETEALIRASKLPFIFLRNGWYHENFTESLAPALEHGAIAGSYGTGRIAGATRQDYAAGAVAVLTDNGPTHTVYELAGDIAYTLSDLAAMVSQVSGKQVAYSDMPEAAYKDFLVSVGLPPPLAHMLADSAAKAAQGALSDTSGTLHRLIGRATTPMKTAVESALSTAATATQ